MKRIKTTILLLSAAVVAMASEQPDTLIRAASVDTLTIVQHKGRVGIELNGIDDNNSASATFSCSVDGDRLVTTHKRYNPKPNVADKLADKYIRDSNSKWQLIMGGLGFGFNTSVDAPQRTGVQMGKSLNFTMLYCLGMQRRFDNLSASLNMGVGIDWRTYRNTTGDMCFVPGPGGRGVVYGGFPENVEPKCSRLLTFSLMVPVLWRQYLPLRLPGFGKMSVAVGPIVDFNVHGSLLNQWRNTAGNEVEQTINHIRQRPITVEAFGALYLTGTFGVYARYTPMSVLRSGSVQFKSFTTGIILDF